MWPTTITGEPLPSDAPTPETRRPQQLTVTNSELPASHLPSAPRRRELLARRNFITSWSPTVRRIGSLTMLPTTVALREFQSRLALRPSGPGIPIKPHPSRSRECQLLSRFDGVGKRDIVSFGDQLILTEIAVEPLGDVPQCIAGFDGVGLRRGFGFKL